MGYAVQGRYYTQRLYDFVVKNWNLKNAMENSESLDRAYNAVVNFEPKYDR